MYAKIGQFPYSFFSELWLHTAEEPTSPVPEIMLAMLHQQELGKILHFLTRYSKCVAEFDHAILCRGILLFGDSQKDNYRSCLSLSPSCFGD